MESEVDHTSVPPPSVHASQFNADFGPPISSIRTDYLPPPAYTAVQLPTNDNKSGASSTSSEPSAIVAQLVKNRFSPTTQQQLNSEQILRVTHYLDTLQRKAVDRLALTICLSVVSILIGIGCIVFFIVYRSHLCETRTSTSASCLRIYFSLVIGCLSILIGILRLIIYYSNVRKLESMKKLWLEKMAHLQQIQSQC